MSAARKQESLLLRRANVALEARLGVLVEPEGLEEPAGLDIRWWVDDGF
jgi:hypothetical protein